MSKAKYIIILILACVFINTLGHAQESNNSKVDTLNSYNDQLDWNKDVTPNPYWQEVVVGVICNIQIPETYKAFMDVIIADEAQTENSISEIAKIYKFTREEKIDYNLDLVLKQKTKYSREETVNFFNVKAKNTLSDIVEGDYSYDGSNNVTAFGSIRYIKDDVNSSLVYLLFLLPDSTEGPKEGCSRALLLRPYSDLSS